MVERAIKNNISYFRSENGYTQEELANLIGVTRQTIISIEKGNYTPSLRLAINISKIFNKKIEELFWLE